MLGGSDGVQLRVDWALGTCIPSSRNLVHRVENTFLFYYFQTIILFFIIILKKYFRHDVILNLAANMVRYVIKLMIINPQYQVKGI